ncbi:abscission/NoCut checkpoint regulator [Toxorhynchites rutilus septentrionalis]|uniref:abscission/NoCut checkpoint regulator n=1 Tax=Toxorhynchites rutilus septentrionalis TaxID=329112 RepID=UPI00247AB7E9|nr:abscission/NoCut checkpoint regulator [Toxorhynchites rutilus septentrionalis]
MACNGCSKSFGLFLREHGCPVCKYSFCSKCLKFCLTINGHKKEVCRRCYELSKTHSIAANQRSDVEHSNSPLKPHKEAKKIEPQTKVESTEASNYNDDLIRERLAALKEHDKSNNENSNNAGSTLVDIEKRLAALKGVEYKDYSGTSGKLFMQKDNRSQEAQITDLMKQFAEQHELHDAMSNYRLKSIEDIEKRLANLRDDSPVPKVVETPNTQSSLNVENEEETDDEIAKKIAQRFLEEAEIEAKQSPKENNELFITLDVPTPPNVADLQELPWCTICNEDAVVRCIGCDGDLYCRSCYKEYHDDEEYRKHETKLYKNTE